MAVATEAMTGPSPARRRRRFGLAVIIVAIAAAAVAAISSTHAALSGGFVEWSGIVPGHSAGLAPITRAELTQIGQIGPTPGYTQVLWATQPGGEVTVGFQVHNGGPVPVTLLGVALPTFDPGVINGLVLAGTALGPGFGQMTAFHPVALGPGDSAQVGLTERVLCDPSLKRDARLSGTQSSLLGDDTSPVVLRYRVLGLTMSQTVIIGRPVLVALPYRSCQ